MGAGKRLIILFTLLLPWMASSQQNLTFARVDSLTYTQYYRMEWKEIVRSGNEALRNEIDFYYLRVRMGVAWYEQGNYLQAARHFEAALDFNAGDAFAGEYLYSCYMELNRPAEALKIYNDLPKSVRDKLKPFLPRLHQASFSAGHLFSDQEAKFDFVDLDGESDYYGETDMILGGNNVEAGLSWGFRNGITLFGGYTWIGLEKNKLVKIGDSLTVDDQYPLYQQQAYLSGNFPLGRGYSVFAAGNYVIDRFDVVMPQYDPESNTYDFPVVSYDQRAFIGYLSVSRDFHIVRASLFGAWSNLNDNEQYQAGFQALVFPFGNLNLYLSSKLLDNIIEGEHDFIYELMAGYRVLKPLWLEVNGTFGRMQDYHEQNAYVVYNFADAMKLKAGARLIWTAGKRTTVTAEYILLFREGEYVNYQDIGPPGNPDIVPVTFPENFFNHIAVLGVNWKF